MVASTLPSAINRMATIDVMGFFISLPEANQVLKKYEWKPVVVETNRGSRYNKTCIELRIVRDNWANRNQAIRGVGNWMVVFVIQLAQIPSHQMGETKTGYRPHIRQKTTYNDSSCFQRSN